VTPGRPAAPWDLGHVRAGLVTTAVLAAAGVPGAWLLRDARAGAWVAVGLAIVAAFFTAGALAVAAAGRVADELTLPAALGSYLVKVVLLGVFLVAVRDEPWLDPAALGLSVLTGTLAWTGVHIRRVWTARLYYVDPG
jgi:ATP synthase protein I